MYFESWFICHKAAGRSNLFIGWHRLCKDERMRPTYRRRAEKFRGIPTLLHSAKFKTHLHKEYGDAIEDIAKMFDTLYAEQQKETPLMWYEYCYGVKDTGK